MYGSLRKGPVISADLCMSPCRSDHIFSTVPFVDSGVWSLRIPGICLSLAFPADYPHRSHCYCGPTPIKGVGGI